MNSNSNGAEPHADESVHPKKEQITQISGEAGPSGEDPTQKISGEAGPSGVDPTQSKAEYIEVKPEVKAEEESDENDDDDDDSDFDFKEEQEENEEDINSEDSTGNIGGNMCKTELDEVETNSDLDSYEENDDDYKRVSVKNYSSTVVEEEPVDFKRVFKVSCLEFEKEKYHQEIFENLFENCERISLKELQAQYLDRIRQAVEIEIFKCCLCKYQTMKLTNLKCHLLMVHNGKLESDLFRCNKCDYETSFQSYMKRHLPTHYSSKKKSVKKIKKEKFPCMRCNYKARTEEALMRHFSSHKDKTQCDLCSFQSQDKNLLKEHKDTHKVGHKFQCYKCPYMNNNKLQLGIHLLNVHKITNEISKRSKICEVCSHSFCNINQLRKHYVTHKDLSELGENEIFKCSECGHTTKYKTNFKLHMKIHRAPEFICEVCGFETRHKRSYELHLITHKRLSEIEWFRCNICPYQARNKKLLYKHMKKGDHSGKKLLHVRNRDRLREAEEKGLPIDPIIRKFRIKKIGGVEIKRERIRRPKGSNPRRKRKSRRIVKPENEDLDEENMQLNQLIRLNQVLLPQIL